jgi:hypothetical protein
MFLREHLKLAVTNWKSSRHNKTNATEWLRHTYVSHLNVNTFSSSVWERFAATALLYDDSFTNPFVEFIAFRVGCGDSTVCVYIYIYIYIRNGFHPHLKWTTFLVVKLVSAFVRLVVPASSPLPQPMPFAITNPRAATYTFLSRAGSLRDSH